MKAYVPLLLAALLVSVPAATRADPLFENDTPLAIVITAPMKALMRARKDTETEFAGTVTLPDQTELDVSLKPRGKSRRAECRFMPLWLDFKKDQTAGTVLAGQNKLKLVTHCTPGYVKRGYVQTEYLAYRLYNLFTDLSFRVRRLEVTYVDADSRKQEGDVYPAFVIEHKKRLGKRLGGDVVDREKVSRSEYGKQALARTSLFQYAIGNTDFSFLRGPDECCHNVVVFQSDTGDLTPIPYDFDSTGLVNPPYAVPAEGIGIQRVTQRTYRGFCDHNAALETARQEWLAKRADIDALLKSEEVQGYRSKQVNRFLEAFFDILDSDADFERRIVKRCR